MENGYIVHEDSQRVVIATGFGHKSRNTKTGNMIQIWILPRNENPVHAVKNNTDDVICGDCPLRGVNGRDRTCYVTVFQAPNQIWKAYNKGNYSKLPSFDVFQGRKVRFGSYGDPVFIPFDIVHSIARVASGWTGYTHQWRNPLFAAYAGYFMASTENIEGTKQAHAQGWRTFRVAANLETLPGEIICPNTTRGITCEQCGLCKGTAIKAKSILIEVHGQGSKNLTGVN